MAPDASHSISDPASPASRCLTSCSKGPGMLKLLLYLSPYVLQFLFLPADLQPYVFGSQLALHVLVLIMLYAQSLGVGTLTIWVLEGLYLFALLGYFGFYRVWRERAAWRERIQVRSSITNVMNEMNHFSYLGCRVFAKSGPWNVVWCPSACQLWQQVYLQAHGSHDHLLLIL